MNKTPKTLLWNNYKNMTQPHIKYSQFRFMFDHNIRIARIRSERKWTVFTLEKYRCYKTRIFNHLSRSWNKGTRYVKASNAVIKKRKVKNALFNVSKNLYRVRFYEGAVLTQGLLNGVQSEQSTTESEGEISKCVRL